MFSFKQEDHCRQDDCPQWGGPPDSPPTSEDAGGRDVKLFFAVASIQPWKVVSVKKSSLKFMSIALSVESVKLFVAGHRGLPHSIKNRRHEKLC